MKKHNKDLIDFAIDMIQMRRSKYAGSKYSWLTKDTHLFYL